VTTYRQAPIKNRPPIDTESWEERGYRQGYQLGITNAKLPQETTQVPNSPIMQGYRAGCKEHRLRKLLLKSRS